MPKMNRRAFLSSTSAALLVLPHASLAQSAKKPPKPAITKGPFVSLLQDGALRVRFETTDPEPRLIALSAPGAPPLDPTPATVREDKVEYYWPHAKARPEDEPFIDKKGTFYLQEATFSGLRPDTRYTWRVTHPTDAPAEGTLRTSPPLGTPYRLGWIADTRQVRNRPTAPLLLAQSPDLVLHGGDIQYQSDPRDTWNGFFEGMKGLMRSAATHFTVGNHEAEGMDELNSQFLRLFDGQGDTTTGSLPGYHTFQYGAVRYIILNSEDDLSAASASPQIAWLRAQLKAANDANLAPVIVLHRPLYTFSRRYPPDGMREHLHPLFTTHKVKLVLTGHNHCYERFEVDGIHYITDGGGGASLYDMDERITHFKRKAPHELPWRKASETSHGISFLDIRPDLSADYTRLRADGVTTDKCALSLA
jgi:predicted phosphodiesterase